jgi:preprotein translocase subunit SecF
MMVIALIVMGCFSFWAHTLRKKPWNFIGHRNYFFIFSAIMIVICIGTLATKGLNYGLDFTGGTIMEVGFVNSPDSEAIRVTLGEFREDLKDARIQLQGTPVENTFGTQKKTVQKVLLQLKTLSNDEVEIVTKNLRDKFGDIEVFKVESIGPVIGQELKYKAILSLVIMLALQLVYITFRFGTQMRYGLAADLGMIHDVIIMVGIYSLVGRQTDSPFLAAVLTVVGYSVMDAIVIFDRIRENLKIIKKATFEEIVNTSVNQTMTRSINTLITVLITLFALYFFGGSTLKNFAFALLIGVTSGAYSSIFISSPILVMLDKWVKGREASVATSRRNALLAEEAARKSARALKPGKKDSSVMEEDYLDVSEVPDDTPAVSSAPARKKPSYRRKKK